ncbi:MAG TPA: VOC family protein [Steroidobacteraceae bacterium]|jgi:catechol 2,3-dioxygenase-like lactoylglutathione lyase family enzyme|nr:VOC family protein [Steroidobacteraceae bacterium]
MHVKKLTPVLVVKRIEPCLDFWERRLGFTRVAEVPEEDHLGFVLLIRDGIEVMYQSWSSVGADIPALGPEASAARQFLFVEVDDLAPFEAALEGIDYIVPKRKTFYGATEVIVREPAGHVVVFAQMERS